MKRFLFKNNKIWPNITQKDLEVGKYLPDHLSIKDIDEKLYEFGLIYKNCVDTNVYSNEKFLKWRHFLMTCFSLFNLVRLSFYIYLNNSTGVIPPNYFDLTKHAGGLVIYILLLQLLANLFAFKLCNIFGRADINHKNFTSQSVGDKKPKLCKSLH